MRGQAWALTSARLQGWRSDCRPSVSSQATASPSRPKMSPMALAAVMEPAPKYCTKNFPCNGPAVEKLTMQREAVHRTSL